ncbi:MAG TPA: hypothetical protein VFY90_09725 [Tepidiformaceae bacterium]|nr:hypothetical protein [Tepidiformaceae bacterium]
MTQFSRFASRGELIETVARPEPKPDLPPAPWFFAAAMAGSTFIAIFGGLVLAFLAAMQTGYASEHWTEAVQAHGRLQLFGWVTVFVVALSFEFSVRFNQRPAMPLRPRLAALLALGVGTALGAAGQVWYERVDVLWPIGQGLMLLGAAASAWLVIRTVLPPRMPGDPGPFWFTAAMLWLVAAATAAFASSVSTSIPVVPLDESRLAVEIGLRGFVLNMILAVGLRAFPGHVDLPPIPVQRQRVLFAGLNASVVAWALGSGAFFLPDIEAARMASDLLLATALLAFTAWSRILGPRPQMTGGPRYRTLIPLAWTGAVAYALMLVIYAIAAPWWDPGIYRTGAVRHTMLLGFMAPMMAAMAHVVLARFGTGRIRHENLLTAGFVFVFAAAPLRIVPALWSETPGDAGRGVMGLAAVALIAGLMLVALVAADTALAVRARHRAIENEWAERRRHAHVVMP